MDLKFRTDTSVKMLTSIMKFTTLAHYDTRYPVPASSIHKKHFLLHKSSRQSDPSSFKIRLQQISAVVQILQLQGMPPAKLKLKS